MNRILIGMLTYDRLDFTKQAIESLYKNTECEFDLIILDNGSKDDTVEYLKNLKYSNLYVIYEKENIGVAKGMNKILSFKNSQQHFMKLDNDIVLNKNIDKKWLIKILDFIDKDIIIKVNNEDFRIGSICLKPIALLKEFEQKVQIDNFIFEFNPEGVLGCSTIYNKNVFSKIGNFIDDLGLYGYEDSLENTRMYLAKFITLFCTDFGVTHIDPGGDTEYLKWKHKVARENFEEYKKIYEQFMNEGRNIFI
jgi:GT2 family glycosyltransferase